MVPVWSKEVYQLNISINLSLNLATTFLMLNIIYVNSNYCTVNVFFTEIYTI